MHFARRSQLEENDIMRCRTVDEKNRNELNCMTVQKPLKRQVVCKMKCPYCQYTESKVIDSRPTDEGEKIRRRRECMRCGKRFTTYEIVETTPLMVVKKDHSIEPFNRDKLFNGLLRACEKRPVSLKSLEQIVDEIEQKLKNSLEGEVNSRRIGELAMEELRRLDQVAYVRFASVYREFQDINSFMDELRAILEEKEREELEK